MNETPSTPPVQEPEKKKVLTPEEAATRKQALANMKKYGRTPVIYFPTRSMIRPPARPGFLTLIRLATTTSDVNRLFEMAKTERKDAHPSTVKKWEKARKVRLNELFGAIGK